MLGRGSRKLYVVALAALVGLPLTGSAHADSSSARPSKSKIHRAPKPTGPFAWCAEEIETLPNGLCYIDGRGPGADPGARRTLVIFLHGMIAKDVDWQWLQ